MEQASLFGSPVARELITLPSGDPDGLRDYQRTRVDQTVSLLSDHRSCVMVLHTGAGKTRCGSAIIKHWKGRILWLAHRDFLCSQARVDIHNLTREYVGLEKAEFYSSDERIVVASVQTLKGDRLKRHVQEKFDLIIVDEGHHATAKSYRNVLEHFGAAKVILLTATPGRADKVGLHNVAESHCDPFGIEEGLEWGSFVPILPVSEFIDAIDFGKVKTQLGDFALGELEQQIAESAAAIAHLVAKHMGDRPTITYTPGVASAHAVAATLRELGLTAVAVDAGTESPERKRVLDDFGTERLQHIVNCGIYTEGLDVPKARGIVIARPTKSESLYIQMAGRGGRPEGWVGNLKTPMERVSAIASSGKPNFKLLDITGHAGRHSLVTSSSILGGTRLKDAKAIVDRAIKEGKVTDLKKAFDEAEKTLREEEEENRLRIAKAAAKASIKSRQATFDPFVRLGMDEHLNGAPPANPREPATAEQVAWLKRNRLPFKNITRADAEKFVKQARKWASEGKATFRMRNLLAQFGFDVNLPFGKAGQIVEAIKRNNFRRPQDSIVNAILRS